ncbi:MAG: hypothetical protein KJN62_08065 [Deltaproteobacteria bacterium]|nr:hypothetical protein [Deltaproteobacteria bacterium]
MVLWISLFHIPVLSYGEEAIAVAIDIAPATLNIQSGGSVVTVHTDISYYAVDFSSVYLNGVFIQSWKADDCGYFVAKFSMDTIKTLDGLIIGDYNTLTLLGATKSGEAFMGADEIKVIDIVPSGKE